MGPQQIPLTSILAHTKTRSRCVPPSASAPLALTCSHPGSVAQPPSPSASASPRRPCHRLSLLLPGSHLAVGRRPRLPHSAPSISSRRGPVRTRPGVRGTNPRNALRLSSLLLVFTKRNSAPATASSLYLPRVTQAREQERSPCRKLGSLGGPPPSSPHWAAEKFKPIGVSFLVRSRYVPPLSCLLSIMLTW